MSRRPDLGPQDCEECDCQQYRWNLHPYTLAINPRETCVCGHPAFRHRFRTTEAGHR